MDNDSIRSVGATTLVDIWINGKLRSICVTRTAIVDSLGLTAERAAALTDDERCDFVRHHMASVVKAAKDFLRDVNPDAGNIVIDSGQLPRKSGTSAAERRKGERRKTERRKADRGRPEGERRKTARRKADRRRAPATKPSDS